MRLSQVLAQEVSSQSRARGHAYFTAGAVRSLSVEQGVVHATVRGSNSYIVWIAPDGPRLEASCSCPYFFDRLEICKHIWAVVLASEAQSIPLVPPDTPVEEMYLEPLDPEDENDFDNRREPQSWPLAPTRMMPQRRVPAPPPPWRQMLDIVGTAGAVPPAAATPLSVGQLLYVVDVLASTQSGGLVLEILTRDRKVNGEWGKPRPAAINAASARSHPDPAERQILERLLGAQPHFQWAGYDTYGAPLSRLQIRGVLVSDVLPPICASGRCLLRMVRPAPPFTPGVTPRSEIRVKPDSTRALAKNAGLTPLEWDDGPPWRVNVSIRASDKSGYIIEGWLARDDQRMELTDPVIILPDGVLFTETHAARLDVGGAFGWLAALHKAGAVTVPADARDALIDALVSTSPRLSDVPDDLRVEIVAGEPKPQLRLRPLRYRPDRLHVELAFDYDSAIVPHEIPQRIVRASGSTRAIHRDADAERRALDALLARGCRLDWNADTHTRTLQLAAHAVPRIVRSLLEEGWHVEVAGHAYRRPGAAIIDVRSGIDWFELHGQVAFDDQSAALPSLLAALARGESFVTLGDGTVGLLPEEWLERYGAIARLGAASGGHLRFKRSQVALLDALIAAQPEASWDETFARARTELQAFEGIQPVDPAAQFTGTLRGYQREGLGWLLFLQRFGFGGCLADDMGLGKTVMVLALLATRREARGAEDPRPSLVVAPRSVVFNWRQEAARFTPDLRVLEYVGSGRSAMRAAFGEYDIVLTTYGTLRQDAAELSAVEFDYVILDEAQAIKNADSVSAKTTRILKARHRLALSGTPIENRLGELWSLFEFLNPGLLGTATAFNRAGTAGLSEDDDAIALLARGLRPFILRRTKEQVAADLPPKTEQTLYCELERPQRALYDELRDHYRQTLLNGAGAGAAGFGRAKLQVLEALLRLRQAACHPGLIDRRRSSEASAKLDVLLPRITEAVAEGHKTLVFSQFTSLLALVRTRLDAAGVLYEYLDGRTRDRQSKVERFQGDPECRLFLISLKAGGLGLNLTAAEYVFLLDPWWNPAVEAQAIDRAHRIGQARHVFAYRLIARDTVEERVLELQQRKRKLADAILSADNSLIRNLRREDLELLLS